MLRTFNIILFVFLPFALAAQSKRELIGQVLTNARDFGDIKPVMDIIVKDEKIFKYIPSIHPIANKNNPRISSPFGVRFHPIDKRNKMHTGIDFVAEFATSIHATAEGKVIFAGVRGSYGKCVIVEHKYGFRTIYAHMTDCYATDGQHVEKGKIIGFLGNTGKSTGAHLHYEVKKDSRAIDPKPFLDI